MNTTEVLERLAQINLELEEILAREDDYDDSKNVFYVDEEASLRKEITRLEKELDIILLKDRLENISASMTVQNDYINKLAVEHWANGYADSQQRDYDHMLVEYSQVSKKIKELENE